ncbi:unnamed protein product [marine sediment metagenome]|uniref:Uncharacterized protein n=1 Tax=marine sediment metagenome TaxID=412755 RepID=X0SDX8_9ZZZZ
MTKRKRKPVHANPDGLPVTKVKRTAKGVVTGQVRAIAKAVEDVQRRFNKIVIQVGKDLGQLSERTMLAWEILWGVLKALENKGLLSPDEIEEGRQQIIEQWHEEEAVRKKAVMTPDQMLCEKCLTVGTPDKFIDEENGGFKCSTCSCPDDPYFKEDDDDSESDEVVQQAQ